ncbi:hypothetical protein GZ77_23205 [Endozoicomonas montiporae]|uniref:Rad50/SbcC-type AAA domain-containing protein n=3 Tax=Endozoicomonas montiporae TaxID=1027273 RepID=A0A081N0M8_9GAMM|nr:ATPase involved in DNA repair [Endozoicomonas montiporae CL-33]KEQ12001.1 hypothetical protein GZ77_23205 [Endozoicomonas montiporae]
MIRNEYLRFMQVIKDKDAPAGVQKIANIILEHLQEILPLGTAQGRRIQKIIALAQTLWQTTPDKISITVNENNETPNKIVRLKNMSVGPFRGFSKTENFDLDSLLVLIYGPNGTGKSSFCEALEYGLLGSVEEAESKRFTNQENYLKNAFIGRFEPPLITASCENGEAKLLSSNEELFRFSFVEKNRIDNFSRIAAHAPSKQTALISTLFGLDSFNGFVKGFSSEISERHIDLTGKKSLELQDKRKALDVHYKTIQEAHQQLDCLVESETELANQFGQGTSFSNMIVSLGTSSKPGLIKNLEDDLQKPLPRITNLTEKKLTNSINTVGLTIRSINIKNKELIKVSSELSFKQLYSAISSLQGDISDYCPACKTPFAQVTCNPFELAENELAKLAHLSKLELERDELATKLSDAIIAVYDILEIATTEYQNYSGENPLSQYKVSSKSSLDSVWWDQLQAKKNGELLGIQHLYIQVQALEERDIQTKIGIQEREQKQKKLTELRELEKEANKLKTSRELYEITIKKSEKSINDFEQENKKLIEEVEAEAAQVEINNQVSNSYRYLVHALNEYKEELPSRLVADLGDIVINLYNSFNRNDAPRDLLAGIKLPLTSGQQIEISFKNAPEKYYNALHILSEGHIRCIGLAILLAKNIKEHSPFLIFDDPVNAIDDDHRESIRKTLFEDDFFASKQIILTCHGEEFFKDIQNLLGVEKTKKSQCLTFLPQLDERHIRVDFNCQPRNYILAAQSHLENLEIREALSKSRQALETLTKGKVWSYVNKYGDGNLAIKMRSAKSPIELRQLTDQLVTKLKKPAFSNDQKDLVLQPMRALAGINGNSREWRYLNKGTHEESDRAEFDRSTVSIIVESLSQLDDALT